MLVLEIVLHRRRVRAKPKAEAIAKFRAAFLSETITQLDNKDVHVLMNHARARHDAAITAFRPFIHPSLIKQFDAGELKFHRCRNQLQPKAAKIIAAIGANKPVDNSDTVAMKNALTELLAFADRP